MQFDGAELTIYDTDGNGYTINLSRTETQVVFKALGVKPTTHGVDFYGEQTLKNILIGKMNPFTVKEIVNGQK